MFTQKRHQMSSLADAMQRMNTAHHLLVVLIALALTPLLIAPGGPALLLSLLCLALGGAVFHAIRAAP